MSNIPFIAPAIKLMNRMSFVKKFSVVSVFFAIPLIILGLALIKEIQRNIDITTAEQEGISLLNTSYELLFTAATYRDLQLIARVNSNTELSNMIAETETQVESALAIFDQKIQTLSTSKLDKQLEILHENWAALKTASAGAAGGPNIQFQYYDSLVNNVEMLVNVVTYDRKLIHDPSFRTFLLINIMIKDIPNVMRSLGKARAYGSYALSLDAVDQHTFSTLDHTYDELIADQLLIEQSLNYALDLNNNDSSINGIANDLVNGIGIGSDYFYVNIIEKDFINHDWKLYYDIMSGSFDVIHDVIKIILQEIDRQLEVRIKQQFFKLYTLMVSTILVTLIVFYLYSGMYFSIKNLISNFAKKANIAASGDLTVKLDTESNDELSQLYIAFNEMISQLKDNQEKLIQAEKMASLSGLIAGVAHEMNTPIGILKTASSQIDEDLDRIQKKFADQAMTKKDLESCMLNTMEGIQLISANVDRCASLISTFKQLRTIDSSKDAPEIDVANIISNAWTIIDDQSSDVLFSINGNKHHKIDSEILTLLMSNIFLNSLSHGFDNKEGEIKVNIETEEDKCLKITISDNGKGMEADVLEKAFEPFYTTNRFNGNVGLGLHIVYTTVTQGLKGDISIYSEIGKGTNIAIKIP